ncbi:MAG: ABC transporter permease [Actinomycetota bacterium]
MTVREVHPAATGFAAWWRGLRTAFWLGWQVDSNWTDPWLFFVYSVARPLGGALILVFMYVAVTAGAAAGQEGMLAYFVVGTACWPMVLGGTQGMAQTVVEDREQWRVTRYVYTAPVPWASYLVGRALARAISLGLPAAVVTLGLGVAFLDVPMRVSPADAAYTLAVLALGIGAILAVGLVAVAVAVTVAGEAWRFPEAASAALYLVSGAVFPPSLLPGPLQALAAALPLTWWLEGMRRGLLGPEARVGYPALSDGRVLAVLGALTLAWVLVAAAMFRGADRRARRLGILDRESSY